MITITISDVANEAPGKLAALANYLLKVAGAPTVESIPPIVAYAPAAPAPAAPAPAAPAPAAHGQDTDINGLPWDSRIHSETKNKNGDGSWRNRRNCDKALIASVEAELRSVMAASSVDTAYVATPVATDVPPAPPAAPAAYDPAAAATAYVAATTPPPAPDAPAPAAAPDSVAALMTYITPFLTNGTLKQEDIARISGEHGLKHAGELFRRPDLIESFKSRVDAAIVANGGVVEGGEV